MFKKAFAGALCLGMICALPATAQDDTIARFRGGVGVIPVSAGAAADPAQPTSEVVNRNFVRGVQPAGQIWVIDKLKARVRADGHIKVEGKGLILGGGNNAGRATGQRVFATLICSAAAPFVQHSTDSTPVTGGIVLSTTGDFVIDDMLTPAPPLDCASPMLLIRTVGSGNWFAIGNLSTVGDDD